MKTLLKMILCALLLTGLAALPLQIKAESPDANDNAKKELIEKLKKDYPLETCVVSGDKFGGAMGKPVEYLYEEPGQPARLVRFCCKDCIKSFKKNPAKYLKMIDGAGTKKKASAKIKKTSAYNTASQGTRKNLHRVHLWNAC